MAKAASFKAKTYNEVIARIEREISRLDGETWPNRIASLRLEADAYRLDAKVRGKRMSSGFRPHQMCEEAKAALRDAGVIA